MVTKTDGVGTPGNLPHVAKDSTFVKWAPDFKEAETKKLDAEIINALKPKHGEQIMDKRPLANMIGDKKMENIDRQLKQLLEAGTITRKEYDNLIAKLPKAHTESKTYAKQEDTQEQTNVHAALDKDTKYISPDGKKRAGAPDKVMTHKESGKLISTTEYWGDYEFTYDATGKHTKTVHKDANGKVIEAKENTYDAKGNLAKEVSKDADGKVIKTKENTYDAKGNLAKEVSKDADGKVIETAENTYDAKGNKTKQVFKDADGKVTLSYEQTYDAMGKCTEAVITKGDRKLTMTWERTYDADGNCINTVFNEKREVIED